MEINRNGFEDKRDGSWNGGFFSATDERENMMNAVIGIKNLSMGQWPPFLPCKWDIFHMNAHNDRTMHHNPVWKII